MKKKPTLKVVDLEFRLAVTIAEVAELTGLSADSIRGEIARGRLRAVRVGEGEERTKFIIPTDALRAWLAGQGGGR